LRNYVASKQTPTTFGRSRDDVITGAGYLVPKNTYFVFKASVPTNAVANFDWGPNVSQRQSGLAGQSVVASLVENQIIKIPARLVVFTKSVEDQFSSVDFRLEWFKPCKIEVKCELKHDTPNLYVQTHEGRHRVHLVRKDGQLVEQVTDIPAFKLESEE
jgi:hypothetical protein